MRPQGRLGVLFNFIRSIVQQTSSTLSASLAMSSAEANTIRTFAGRNSGSVADRREVAGGAAHR